MVRASLRNWLPVVMLLSMCYLALSPMVAMPLYNRMIFEPDKDGNFFPDRIADLKVEPVWFNSTDGHKLFGWYIRNPIAKTTVLLSHGNGGDITDRVPLIAKILRCGASVFTYDYEGFGLSSGQPTLNRICRDGESAYAYLTQQRHVAPRQLILFGESLGTGVTCQLAKAHQSAGIVLQSAFTSLLSIARERMSYLALYPDALFPAQRLDNLQAVQGHHPKLLLVHGELDPEVPVNHALQLFKEASSPKRLVLLPDAEHDDVSTVDAQQYDNALKAFLG